VCASSSYYDIFYVLRPSQSWDIAWRETGHLLSQLIWRSPIREPQCWALRNNQLIVIVIIVIITYRLHISGFLSCCFHAAQWRLTVLPIAICNLKLDDEAVRVAVGLRLWLNLCEPHQCHCGSVADVSGLHSFVCKGAPGRSARHRAFNDLHVVARSFASAGVSATKKPAGLSRTNGKRSNGTTLVPWQSGKSLCRDVIVICSLVESYVKGAARQANAAASSRVTQEGEICRPRQPLSF